MGVRERLEAKRNKNNKSVESQTSNSGKKMGVRERVEAKRTIGFDTLESDLHTMGETLNNIYGSWQTKETMDNTFESVNNMYTRLGKYQDYYTQYGKESGLPDLSELLNTYKGAVEGWGGRTELYGNYQNADAFNKAVKNFQLSEKFKGLSYGDVQARMRRYSPDSDEYNYLKNYTGYTSTEDFDKALAGLSTDIGMFDKANEYEGRISSYEGQADKFKKRTNGLTNDGGYGKKADDTRVEYNAWLAENGFDSGNALKAEYADEVKLAKELGKAKNIYELDNSTADKYKYLEQNEDFAEHSQYDSSVNEGKKPHYQPFTNYDIKYDYINNVPEIRDSYERKAGNKDAGTAFSDNGWEYLTEKELAYYNYLHYLDGQNGTKKSDKFLEDLKPALQKRYSEKASERREEMLENPFAATAFSLASPIMTIAGGIGNLMATGKDIVTGSEYNPYDPLREISNANAHGREVVSQNIAEATKGFELFGQNIASFLYNTGESVLDTVVGGSAFGRGYTALMGTNAYQQKAKELTEQGYDATTVQGLAITSGVLEMAFEYAGFDHLMKLKDADSIGKVIYNALVSQGGAEGLEELGTSIGNMIAEYGFLGEDSQYMKKYNDLIARGFSEKEASIEVAKAMASELAWSFAGGWLSGAGLGAGTSIGQYTQNKAVGKDLRGAERIGDVLNIASMTPHESEAYEAYTRYANKGVNADNITDAQIGNLYRSAYTDAKAVADSKKSSAEQKEVANKTLSDLDAYISSRGISTIKDKELTELFDDESVTALIESGLESGKDTNSFKLATELKAKIDRGEKPSAKEIRSLYEANRADISAEESADVEARMTELGKAEGISEAVAEGDVSKIAKAIERKMYGETLTEAESKLISDSKYGLRVYAEKLGASEEVAEAVKYMDKAEGKLFFEQHDGVSDINEYTNSFQLVTSMAKNNFSEDALLKAKGSLSTEQFNAIYAATVTEKYKEKQRNIDKLNAEMAGKMSYKGVIDDSVINYGNEAVKGKVKWSELKSRQREAVTFISGFAKATGMNLKFIANDKKKNGSYDPRTNTITIDVYAGIDKAKNAFKDTIIPTMSHEATHWMKEKSPELYKKMGDLVFKTLEAHDGVSEVGRVASEVARQKANGKNITDDGARDEIIARACEDMLKMSEEGKRLFNSLSESEKKTFIDKVKEILANLMEWVDNLLNSYEYSKRYEARIMREYKDTLAELSKMWDEMLVSSVQNNSSMELAGVWGNEVTSIGGRDLSEFSDAVNTDGDELFQYRAMEEDEDTYRNMLLKYKDIIGINVDDIEALFNMVDKALGIIKNNLEALDYGWDTDINDRAFMPIKPNSDSLYQVSLDFSTLCRKRLLQQTIQNTLQEALQKQLSTEEAIAIRDELMKIQEEGKKIEIACALCYVESARMKSPKQINKFLNNRDAIIREFFANRSGGSIKQMVADAEMRARQELARQHPNGYKGKNDIEVDVLTAPKKQLKTKDAQFVRDEGKKAKASYELTAKEQAELDAALELNVSDFTSADGLESLAKDHSDIFDAYVSFVRNATHSKGIEKDTWWRAGDSDLIGDTLIANMNKENGLRSQSWSDFQVIHLLDYIAATIELSTKGAKRQSYTKVPDYVKLLGNTGDMINMSLIPERVFNGKLSYDGVEGMAYEIAKQLRDEYHATAGTICIGITNDQIKMLLADKTIDMVIPYHKSSMSQATRKLMHIPTWDDYEDYQQEKKLDDNEAKAQAKRYGVELKMDGNYQKAPKFSEWFDIDEARQIAKKNKKASDIMYGGYIAMQNAANKYLKLCAERGLSPKFSHQNADFTGEENYWKLLIDRKMVDNVTGEIIEQKAIKPIFSEKSVLEILNDELERYPQIKKDNDYAASKVVKKFLSGEMKVDKSTLEALKKPVDNVAVLNILESADDAVQNDDRDSDGEALTKEQIEFFKNSKVRDANGRLLKVYHGSASKFTVFLHKFLNSHGNAHGRGFYFTEKKSLAEGYYKDGGQLLEGYLNIEKPLSEEKVTIKKADLAKLIKATCEEEARSMVEDEGYKNIKEALPDTWVSNYVNTYSMNINDVYKEVADIIYSGSDNDVEIIAELTNAGAGNENVLRLTRSILGYDGVIYENEEGYHEFVSLTSNQFKNIDNTNPTMSDDIRYSDRDDDISVYEKMGELDRVLKERDILKEDIQRLHERLKLEGKVTNGKYFTDSSILNLAGFLLKKADSKYDKVELAKRLKSLYHGMTTNTKVDSDALWSEVLEIANDIALMAKPKIVKNDYALNLLKEIKGARVRFNSNQKAEAKARFGANWNRSFFGKIILADNANMELDEQWKVWAEEHPDIFDANVNDGNQVAELYDIINALKEQSEVIEEYNKEEFVQYIATEILGATWNLKPIVTTADKYTAKIKEIRSEHKQAMKDVRDAYNARVDEARLAERMHFGAEIAKLRRQKDEKVAEAKELGKQKMAEYKENIARKTILQSTMGTVTSLNKKLTTNSKDVHIPDSVKPVVIKLLNAIDFSSKQLLGISEAYRELHGTPTAKDISLENTFSKVHSMETGEADAGSLKRAIQDALKLFQNAGDVLKGTSDGTVDSSVVALDKDMVDDIEKMIEDIDILIEKGETTFVLQKMSTESLKTLNGIVKSINHWAIVADKALANKHKNRISELGMQTIAETNKYGKRQEYIKGIEDVKNFFNWSNLLPVNAFKRLGDAATEFFNGLRDSQDKVTFNRQEVMDFTDELLKKYKAYNPLNWRTEVKTFDVKLPGETDATKVTMPVSYIMTLYCVAKQEDAQRHLYGKDENGNKLTYTDEKGNVHDGGGMTIKGFKEGKLTLKVNKSLDNTIVNESIVKQITSVLTKEQIEVADALQKYMNDKGSEWGNAVSMALYGIKKFAVKDYFPLTVSPHTLSADKIRDVKASFFSILNYGFTKERNPNAKQSIEIGDIFEVFANHMNMLSIYNAYALSVFDIARWYNFKGKNENGKEISVTASIEKAFGKGALTYVSNLIKDLNGQHEPSRLGFISEMFKRAKVAMVGNSISVALLQPTAYLKAMVKIPPKYLLKSALHIKDFGASNGVRKAKKYCGIALLKSQGYFETGVSANTATKMMHDESLKEKLTEWSLKGAEWMDERTWGALWNACEFMIRDARKDLKVGSEEFYHAVADKLRDVIYETQVVDSPLTKSDLMRSGDTGAKMVTMFASEMTVAYNMVFESAFQTHLDSKRYGLTNALKKNAKNLYMTFMAYTLTSVANAALSTFVDSFRYGGDDDEEDENEFLKNFLSDWFIIGKIPYFKEIISFSQGYSSSRTDTLWLESMFKAYKYWKKAAEGKDGATMKAFDESLKTVSYISGTAVYNQWRDLRAMLKFIGIME